MKIFLLVWLLAFGAANAETTSNLIGNGFGYGHQQWQNIGGYSQLNGQLPGNLWGCCTSYSGAAPFLDTSTGSPNGQSGQIHWSYGYSQIQQIIAINQALNNVGVQINGYNWGYEIRNMNGSGGQNSVDSLTATTFLKNNNGQVVLSDSRVYDTPTEWNWHGGSVISASPITDASQGQLGISFTSYDAGYWAGYYGPQVRNVSLSLNYSAAPIDPCTSDPLSSPSCPGYAQAYHDQQCSANPLYAISCPGYQAAYYNQQCSINPLYDSGCPGYQQAYFDQQCTQNGLYSRNCPNYAEAYARQNLLSSSSSDTQRQNTSNTSSSTSEPQVTVRDDGKVTTDVQIVSDSTVNQVLTDNAKTEVKSSTASNEVTPTQPSQQPGPVASSKTEQKQTEQKKTDTEVAKIEKKSEQKDSKTDSKTKENAKKEATEKAKELANDMSKAVTLEAQSANQGLVLGLMNYVPGFSAYANAIVPDTNASNMNKQYNKPVTDNRSALRQLNGASDKLHQEMINGQYK